MKQFKIPMGKISAVGIMLEGLAACVVLDELVKPVLKNHRIIRNIGISVITGVVMETIAEKAVDLWTNEDMTITVGNKPADVKKDVTPEVKNDNSPDKIEPDDIIQRADIFDLLNTDPKDCTDEMINILIDASKRIANNRNAYHNNPDDTSEFTILE